MKRFIAGSVFVVGASVLAVATAQAATISIQATSIASGGSIFYVGRGDIGGGIGHGDIQIGSCVFNVGTNQTICSVAGTYVETAGSHFTPGATGTFL